MAEKKQSEERDERTPAQVVEDKQREEAAKAAGSPAASKSGKQQQ